MLHISPVAHQAKATCRAAAPWAKAACRAVAHWAKAACRAVAHWAKAGLSRRSPLGEGGKAGSLPGIFRRLLQEGLAAFLAAKIISRPVILHPGSLLGHFD